MKRFSEGMIVELKADANAIPAGRYRYLGEDDNFLIFSIGRKILFGVSAAHWGEHLERVTDLQRPLTTKMEFLDRYFRLCDALTGAQDSLQRLTFCALDPSVMSEAA